ncbi:hypothetical protein GH714_031017 [Hevea brasiliensis]|uniref:Uncharacterized protein n=1 Tax=Hevea brasiliensis TaxID=3981 RepID=A0A6A6N8C8_HEVBR|nr:hypothetical protein GH714_031017 [Hevea brasiliensis]
MVGKVCGGHYVKHSHHFQLGIIVHERSSKKHSVVKDSSSDEEEDTRQTNMPSEIGLSNAYKVNEGLEKSCASVHSLDQQAACDNSTHLGNRQLHVSPIGGDNCDDSSCSRQPLKNGALEDSFNHYKSGAQSIDTLRNVKSDSSEKVECSNTQGNISYNFELDMFPLAPTPNQLFARS